MPKKYHYHAFIAVRIAFLASKKYVRFTSEKLLKLEDWPSIEKEVKTLILRQLIAELDDATNAYLEEIQNNPATLEDRAFQHIDVMSFVQLGT